MMKPDLNSVEVHLQLSHNGHPVDGVLVGAGSLWPICVVLSGDQLGELVQESPECGTQLGLMSFSYKQVRQVYDWTLSELSDNSIQVSLDWWQSLNIICNLSVGIQPLNHPILFRFVEGMPLQSERLDLQKLCPSKVSGVFHLKNPITINRPYDHIHFTHIFVCVTHFLVIIRFSKKHHFVQSLSHSLISQNIYKAFFSFVM